MTEDKDKIIAKLKANLKVRDKQLDDAMRKIESREREIREFHEAERRRAAAASWGRARFQMHYEEV